MPKTRKKITQKELSKILEKHHKKMLKDPVNSCFLVIENRDLSGLVMSSKYLNLTRIHLIDCDLIELTLDNLTLDQAVFTNCNLSLAIFSDTSIINYATFKNCDLSYTNLGHANLCNATFDGCKYRKMYF